MGLVGDCSPFSTSCSVCSWREGGKKLKEKPTPQQTAMNNTHQGEQGPITIYVNSHTKDCYYIHNTASLNLVTMKYAYDVATAVTEVLAYDYANGCIAMTRRA